MESFLKYKQELGMESIVNKINKLNNRLNTEKNTYLIKLENITAKIEQIDFKIINEKIDTLIKYLQPLKMDRRIVTVVFNEVILYY